MPGVLIRPSHVNPTLHSNFWESRQIKVSTLILSTKTKSTIWLICKKLLTAEACAINYSRSSHSLPQNIKPKHRIILQHQTPLSLKKKKKLERDPIWKLGQVFIPRSNNLQGNWNRNSPNTKARTVHQPPEKKVATKIETRPLQLHN